MCISVCARHIKKLLRQSPLPVTREMSAHSESGASLKFKLQWKKVNRKDSFELSKLLNMLYCRASIFFIFCHCCGCGNMFLSISMIACQTCLIFQEYIRGLTDELIEKKKTDLFSLTGCKNLPTVTAWSCFVFDLAERLNSFDIILWRFQSW